MAPDIGMVKQAQESGINQGGKRQGLRTRDVFSYLLLPKVLPRFADLFFTGFSFFAFFIAQVYRGVRLLPEGHPSLNPSNIGQFGIRDVIGAAFRNLVWRKENIDQIIIFVAILLGLFLLVLQAATFIIALAMPQAVAAGLGGSGLGFSALFGTPAGGNAQDIAFILLDRVFGVPGIFNSCVSTSTPCYGVSADALSFDTNTPVYKPPLFPWPYHDGLHALFQFYSMGLLLVAVFILLYLVIVIVAETAQTGTPFGKRFNTVWAPIRLVMALGLLIPIANGLNSAQYITLYAAKWGSNFATNGWVLFNKTILTSSRGGANAMAGNMNLTVKPQESEAAGLLQFMTLAHTCKVFEETNQKPPEDDSMGYTSDTVTSGNTTTITNKDASGVVTGSITRVVENGKTTTSTFNKDGVLQGQPVVSNGTETAANGTESSSCMGSEGVAVEAYIVKPGFDAANSYKFLRNMSYSEALNFAENSDIKIRFGDRNCERANAAAGNIQPTCGEITLPTNSLTETGARSIQEGYFNLIKYLWGGFGSGDKIETYANPNRVGANSDSTSSLNACTPSSYRNVLKSGTGIGATNTSGSGAGGYDEAMREYALAYYQRGVDGQNAICPNENGVNDGNLLEAPPEGWENEARQHYMYGANEKDDTSINQPVKGYNGYAGGDNRDVIIRNILKRGVADLQRELNGPPCTSQNSAPLPNDATRPPCNKHAISPENLQRGWAAAGIWYNKIAEMNGSLIGAAMSIPNANRYPNVMMSVLALKRAANVQVSPENMFSPDLGNGTTMVLENGEGTKYALAMNSIYKHWEGVRPNLQTGNVMSDFINVIFGTQGLFDLRAGVNKDSHPLAQLVGVGKGLIEASIRNLGIGMGSGLGSIVAGLAVGGTAAPGVLTAISSFFFSIATVTLTAGFILFYVIPFLPFLYFFFAVGNWLKGVFEAMVGVPLWALAHLRIDGNGLPGEAAINGYFMLFEIFLRPIMVLFGFLASISIFTAMATVFHEIFEVAVNNLTGAGTTGSASKAVDNFFYTCMYAVIMYIMALSSFKLIDLIPNQIMRWMGTNVSTFSDMQQDPAGNLTNYTAIAGNQMIGGLTGGLQQGMTGMSGAAAALNKSFKGQ